VDSVAFPQGPRTAGDTSPAVAVAGRAAWTWTLDVADLSAGGSLTVVLERTDRADGTWTTLSTVTATEMGTTETALPTLTAAQTRLHVLYRARVSALTGTAVASVRLGAPFFTLAAEADAQLLTKELREYRDGGFRLTQQAEDDVLTMLLRQPAPVATLLDTETPTFLPPVITPDPLDTEALADAATTPYLDLDLTIDGVGTAIRREIAEQAEHLYQREKLRQSRDPAALVSLRTWSALAPGLGRFVAPYRRRGARVWRGR
jgi:hypothetical protein